MIRVLLALVLWFSAATSCAAGAWMRGEGEGFLSLRVNPYEDAESDTPSWEQNLYIEYGLRPKLTIGAQVNYTAGEKGDGLLFVRLPLRDDDRPSKLAVEVGLGAESFDGISFDPFVKTGLSWGRGFSMGERNGWINVDGAVQIATEDKPELYKLDATVGLTLSDRFQVMGQSFLEGDENGESLNLVPSIIYRPKRGNMRIVVGLEHKTGRYERTGLRFGLWREF